MKRTVYVMAPESIGRATSVTLLEILLPASFESVEAGREQIRKAGNDPDKGHIIKVTYETLDAAGNEEDTDDVGDDDTLAAMLEDIKIKKAMA